MILLKVSLYLSIKKVKNIPKESLQEQKPENRDSKKFGEVKKKKKIVEKKIKIDRTGLSNISIELWLEDLYPLSYIKDNKVLGKYAKNIQSFLDYTGVTYVLKEKSWEEIYNKSKLRSNILIGSVLRSEGREKKFHWIGPIGKKMSFYIFKHRENKFITPKTIYQLSKYKIGIIAKSIEEKIVSEKDFNNIELYISRAKLLKDFFSKKIDLIVSNKRILKSLSERYKYDFYQVTPIILLYSYIPHIVLSLNTDGAILQKFKKKYDELLKKGLIFDI